MDKQNGNNAMNHLITRGADEEIIKTKLDEIRCETGENKNKLAEKYWIELRQEFSSANVVSNLLHCVGINSEDVIGFNKNHKLMVVTDVSAFSSVSRIHAWIKGSDKKDYPYIQSTMYEIEGWGDATESIQTSLARLIMIIALHRDLTVEEVVHHYFGHFINKLCTLSIRGKKDTHEAVANIDVIEYLMLEYGCSLEDAFRVLYNCRHIIALYPTANYVRLLDSIDFFKSDLTNLTKTETDELIVDIRN